MSLLESIFSGILQGITEFLPVSSSGHLVLLHDIFGIKESTLCFDILLHLATLLAVIIYFSGDIADLFRKRDYKLIGFLITGTIPAVFAGFFLEDFFDSFFREEILSGFSVQHQNSLFRISILQQFHPDLLDALMEDA